jgi:hypothetical protein
MTYETLERETHHLSDAELDKLLTSLIIQQAHREDPDRPRKLAEKLDDPARWLSYEEAKKRLGLTDG